MVGSGHEVTEEVVAHPIDEKSEGKPQCLQERTMMSGSLHLLHPSDFQS